MSQKLFELAKSRLGTILVELGFTTPLRKLIPVRKVYEDELVFAFYHPKPFWDKHIVIVPTRKISVLDAANELDQALLGHLCLVAGKLATELGWDSYTLVTNGGKYQKVKYLHFHLGSGAQI